MPTTDLQITTPPIWRNNSRDDLKKSILKALGAPVIKVNLSDSQLDECINYSLKKMWKYHPDFSFENYYIKQLTLAEATKGGFSIPYRIEAVTNMIPQGINLSNLNFGTWQYQIARETFMGFSGLTSLSLVDYVMMQERLTTIGNVLGNTLPCVHVRLQSRVQLLFPVKENDIVAFKVNENVDPDDLYQQENYNSELLYDEELFRKFVIGNAKEVWGGILRRYQGMVLPGNVQIDGQSMINEGIVEQQEVMDLLMNSQVSQFYMG